MWTYKDKHVSHKRSPTDTTHMHTLLLVVFCILHHIELRHVLACMGGHNDKVVFAVSKLSLYIIPHRDFLTGTFLPLILMSWRWYGVMVQWVSWTYARRRFQKIFLVRNKHSTSPCTKNRMELTSHRERVTVLMPTVGLATDRSVKNHCRYRRWWNYADWPVAGWVAIPHVAQLINTQCLY